VKLEILENRGSILILVLWVLALLAYLTGDYLAHNREKSAICSTSWNVEKGSQAINSVMELFATDASPLSGQEEESKWLALSPGGVKVWIKVEKEKERINMNSAPDPDIREKILELMTDDNEERADKLIDAILDWRDPDNLTRLHGAESEYYENQGLPYGPGNGPFKALTELLLVRGMTTELFWGDPLASINEKGDGEKSEESGPVSISDAFTLFDGSVKRLTMVIRGRGNAYDLVLAFLRKRGVRWQPFQVYRTTLISSMRTQEAKH